MGMAAISILEEGGRNKPFHNPRFTAEIVDVPIVFRVHVGWFCRHLPTFFPGNYLSGYTQPCFVDAESISMKCRRKFT